MKNMGTQSISSFGASLDWSRSSFTMDEQRSKAVTEAFVRLYERGLIFRGRRVVNWCPILNTAISDIEIDLHELEGRTKVDVLYREKCDPKADKESMSSKQSTMPVEFGVMYKIKYPLSEGASGQHVVISTTRPETIPGDIAVAVHPQDSRYKFLFQKRCPRTFASDNWRDFAGNPGRYSSRSELGSGAVKISSSP